MDTRTQSIFEDAFAALGRLDNISVVMGFHPQYLESFLRTQHYLLQMDGPLSLHYRHYIGIMVRSAPAHTPLPPLPDRITSSLNISRLSTFAGGS